MFLPGGTSCLLGELRSPLALQGPPQDSSRIASGMNRTSSRVEAGTSEFLSIFDFDRSISAELEQESPASSCVEEWNSAWLSSCSWGDRPQAEPCGSTTEGHCLLGDFTLPASKHSLTREITVKSKATRQPPDGPASRGNTK